MNYFILAIIFLFGLIIGSFLNCLIWRLHKKESIWGRSYCPKCGKQIAWYDNIPIFSFAFLQGKCRHCRKKISWQYPIVELITAILFVIAFIFNLPGPNILISQYPNILTSNFLLLTLKSWFIIAVMIIVFIYDLRWFLILDIITLPACAVMLILNLLLGFNLWNLVFSGIIGSSFFLLQFVISRGKWIGGGDIRLGLLMGLALGWPNIIVGLFIAYFMGAIIGLGLILAGKKKWGSQIPLGIFLSIATIITLFWGEQILNWYLNVIIF